MGSTGNFARAARFVFRDRSLWWRTPILGATQLVPILGSLVVTGYMMVIMRDAAWSINRGLPYFGERDQILRQGFTGVVVSLVWGLLLGVVFIAPLFIWGALTALSGDAPAIPWWFGLAISTPIALLSVFLYVALVRAAIYQKISVGLSISGIRALIAANREGFKDVAWPALAVALLGVMLSAPSTFVVRQLDVSPALTFTLPYVWTFGVSLLTIPLHLTVAHAYGLWAGDTDPASWPPLSPPVESHDVVMDMDVAGAQGSL